MALTVTPANFKAKFPEIRGNSDATIASFIAEACEISSVSRSAILYLTAHLIIIDKEEYGGIDGGSGEVSTESIGGKSLSYKTGSESERDTFFTRTKYGRKFLMFEKRSPKRTFGVYIQ